MKEIDEIWLQRKFAMDRLYDDTEKLLRYNSLCAQRLQSEAESGTCAPKLFPGCQNQRDCYYTLPVVTKK